MSRAPQIRTTRTRNGRVLCLAAVVAMVVSAEIFAQGAQPSGDCARAASVVEQTVCSNDALTALDGRLADVYATASNAASADQKNRLAADQQRLLNERSACCSSYDHAACIKEHYMQRNADMYE